MYATTELQSKPTDLVQKQALAAVGQALLMRYYDDFFSTLGKHSAQVRSWRAYSSTPCAWPQLCGV